MADRNPIPEDVRNVGGYDRIARVVLGVALFAIAVYASTAGRRSQSLPSSRALSFDTAPQFRGINAVLGLDTCEWNPDEN